MESIPQMDYTILLISDAYLKSANCMYEVLEVMRDRRYKDKIFPAVIYTGIYKPVIRASYVKYWQDELENLNSSIQGINPQNLGPLSNDLKRLQDIASNIAAFLDVVADMNNPQIEDVANVIKSKLENKGFYAKTKSVKNQYTGNDMFAELGISSHKIKNVYTDLDINQFMVKSFREVIQVFKALCKQFEADAPEYTVVSEDVDTRNSIFQFYKNGNWVTGIKIILEDSFGNLHIGISNNLTISSSTHSWNNLYSPIIVDGELKLKGMMSLFGGSKEMNPNEVVKDIWTNHIDMYLNR